MRVDPKSFFFFLFFYFFLFLILFLIKFYSFYAKAIRSVINNIEKDRLIKEDLKKASIKK